MSAWRSLLSDMKAYLFRGPSQSASGGFRVDLGLLPFRLDDSGSTANLQDSRNALNVTHFEIVLESG
jgi:hypothetical protein